MRLSGRSPFLIKRGEGWFGSKPRLKNLLTTKPTIDTKNQMTNHADRRWRMEEILKKIPQTEISKEKQLAIIQFDWGFSRRTSKEYLDVLINAGYVQENKNMVWRK